MGAVGSTFFVAWQDSRDFANSATDIYGTRVVANGTTVQAQDSTHGVPLATGATTQSGPVVAGDGTNFQVAWTSSVGGTPPGSLLGGRVVAATGARLDGPTGLLLSAPSGQEAQIVTGLASAGARSFLVAYQRFDSSSAAGSWRARARLLSNAPPVMDGGAVSTNEDTALGVTLTGADADGDAVTGFTVQTPPSHGALSGTPPNLTYTPALNYFGSDAFTFTGTDGFVTSAPGTFTIAVNPVNDAPVATAQTATTAEDTAQALTLAATDVDGTQFTFTTKTAPAHGTLSNLTGASVTYTPNLDSFGTDSFTFIANDGLLDSPPATVTLTITPVNDGPVAQAQTVTTAGDAPKAIVLAATDVDSATLTYALVDAPAHGTLSGSPPAVTYAPAANYNGTDSFTFRANDGLLDSAKATVTLGITPVPDAPVGEPQNLLLTQDVARDITLRASDADLDSLAYRIGTGPTHGALTGTPPNVTYTPSAGFRGNDTFTFIASDGVLDSVPASVGLSVSAVNHPPVPVSPNLTTAEDTALDLTLSAIDPDGDALTYQVVVPPTNGTVTGSGATRTYTPGPNFHGADSFIFRAHDGIADSADGVVRVTVTPVNDPPLATAQSVSTPEDTAVSIVLAGTDPDGTTPTFAVVTPPQHGTYTGNPPNLTYTPAPDFNGTDELTFTASDDTSTSPAATVSITVVAVNDAPVVKALAASTTQGTPVSVTAEGTDVEGDVLTFAIATPPAHGAVTGTAPEFTYTPSADFTGTDTFTYSASDGTASSAPATITITVTPPGSGPGRDTVHLNGWSCGCSESSGGAGPWALALLGLWVLQRRPRAGSAAVLVALVLPLVAQAKPTSGAAKKTTTSTRPAPVPPPSPIVAPTEPPPPPAPVAAAPPPAPRGPPSLATLDVVVTAPNEKLDATAFTEMLTVAADQSKLYRVVSARDVGTMLGLERQRQLLGCSDDTGCIAELADALGTDFVLQGTVGKVGETYLVTVRLIDSRRSRAVGRAANQTSDANQLLTLVWTTAQQAIDAWGTTLAPDEARHVAERPRQVPLTAAPPSRSKFGVLAMAVGSYQPLAAAGNRGTVGAEVALTWRPGRFELGAGVVVSQTPGARVSATWALTEGQHRVSVGLRASAFPEVAVYGGGPVGAYELALGEVFALRASAAAEAYGSAEGLVVALLGGLGVSTHF